MDAESRVKENSGVAPKVGDPAAEEGCPPPIKLDEVRPPKAEVAASAPGTPSRRMTDKPADKAVQGAANAGPANAASKSPATKPPGPRPALVAGGSGSRLMGLAEKHGYQAAGALVVLGIGWIIGANTFDNRASEKRVSEALVALDNKIDGVSGKLVTGGEVAALKRNIDEMKRAVAGSRRTTAAISDLRGRFEASERTRAAAADGLVEKVAARLGKEQGERLDKLAERLDKIDQLLASQIPTASIPAPQARATAPAPAVSPSATASSATAEAPAKDKATPSGGAAAHLPVNGYVLRQVYDGVALVEGRKGLMEVEPGDLLPGAGRVRSIERRNRKWVVVTSTGVIDTSGY